jgi:ketosteroid isomerase-like protein
MPDSFQNKQIIQDAYDAMASGNVKGFLGILDPQIEVREPDALPYGGVYRGIDELLGMFAKAAPILDSSRMVVAELIAEGDNVVALLRIPLRDGSGESLICEHWRLRDGKAVQLQVFWFDTGLVAATAA